MAMYVWKGRWGLEAAHLQSEWLWRAGLTEQGTGSFVWTDVVLPVLTDLLKARPCILVTFLIAAPEGRKTLSWLIL